ncbi:MAG: hypothetical protein CL483_05440 [Acidobacteria bacterium]|nr:hypothetical protein [Acidobacteriota bacterium]|tara:strand:+ start:382 stop:1125 length:744 start_codon:yes stop_codon:yes gene_type:complete
MNEETVVHPDLDVLLEQTSQALGEQLRSIVLYGSAARGDWQRATSDLNLIIVVNQLDPADLEALSPALTRWESGRQPLPLLFTPAMISDSADVFPIEFLDLQSDRRVLYGDDPFAEVEIRSDHLRLQCEREMREKLMRLREGYIETHARPRRLRRLLTDSYTTFVALFRGCLHLHRDAVPEHNEEVVSAFCRRAGLDEQAFGDVARLKHSEDVAADEKSVFGRYYAELNRAVTRIDRFVLGTEEESA